MSMKSSVGSSRQNGGDTASYLSQSNGKSTPNWGILLGGSALVLWGLRRGSKAGLALAAAGGTMVYRTLSSTLQRPITIERTVTIHRPAEDIYTFWRNFENLPRVMEFIDTISVSGSTHSHWVSSAFGGKQLEWDVELVEEKLNEELVWRSVEGAPLKTQGYLLLKPAPNGDETIVTLGMEYTPPGGFVGAMMAKASTVVSEPMIASTLYRLKQLMETGEMATTIGQAKGGKGSDKREKWANQDEHERSVRYSGIVDQASQASFPASDPPSWTTGRRTD